MMRTILLIAAILLSYVASAQTIGQLRYDTVKILKVGGNGELKVQNSTRDSVGGIFTNVGNGWGQWLKPRQVGDTLFIGLDSFIVVGGAARVYAENGLTAVNDSTLRLGGTLLDTTDINIPQGTRFRLLANGANGYMLDNQKPPWLVFKASDTISNNTYADAGSASFFGRDVFFNTNRRDYYRGFEFRNNLMTSDSTRLFSVGGDFGYSMKSGRVFTRQASDDTRSVWLGGTTDFDAAPNFIAWDNHKRPTGQTSSQRSRGWWSGISSYLITNAADTVDNYIAFHSNSRVTSTSKVLKYYDFYGGGGAYSNNRVDSAWFLFSKYSQQRSHINGPLALGGDNTGPTEALELVGNFKHFNLRSSNADDDSMVVWNETDKMYGKRPISSGGGSTNLANTDLTQTAAIRVFNLDAQALYWDSIGSMRWYNDGGTSRIAELEGNNRSGYWGDPSGESFGFTADSLFLNGLGRVTDTTQHQIIARTPTGGLVWISAGALAGGGGSGPSFGTDNQVPFTNSGGTDFDYSSGFTFNGTALTVNSGADVNVPNALIIATSTRSITIGPGAANQGMIQNTGTDNNAGITLRTRLSVDMASFTRDILYFQTNNADRLRIGLTEAVFNEPGNNYDIRMEGDTDANLFFSDASTDRIGIGTNTPGFKFDVNGMINTPGTEASTYRWAATATEVPATTTYAAPTNYIGSSTNYALFTPNAWLRVNVAGTLYGIPAYIITTP